MFDKVYNTLHSEAVTEPNENKNSTLFLQVPLLSCDNKNMCSNFLIRRGRVLVKHHSQVWLWAEHCTWRVWASGRGLSLGGPWSCRWRGPAPPRRRWSSSSRTWSSPADSPPSLLITLSYSETHVVSSASLLDFRILETSGRATSVSVSFCFGSFYCQLMGNWWFVLILGQKTLFQTTTH